MQGIAEPDPALSELALAHAWTNGAFPNRLTTRDGVDVEIVYRGVWTHGLGPDLRDAMIAWPDGRLETGSIELHLRTSGWRAHRHHQDPAYDQVVLHIVGIDDGAETRRSDGRIVPVCAVGLERARYDASGPDWSRVGGEVCAAELSAQRPAEIVQILRTLGDARLATWVAAFEAELAQIPPDQVLWTSILDVLGISENREPMRKLAALLPIADLERVVARNDHHLATSAGLLLGTGGFLPLTPADAHLGGCTADDVIAIETAWNRDRRPESERVQPGEWRLTRVRPANHPVARLIAAAALVALLSGGLSATLLDPLRSATFRVEYLIERITSNGGVIGTDRAIVLTSRVLIPYALALAEQTGDSELADGAMATWDLLKASGHNQQTRAAQLQITGGPPLRKLGERGMQGLIQLHRTRCLPRRCFECPIAALAISAD